MQVVEKRLVDCNMRKSTIIPLELAFDQVYGNQLNGTAHWHVCRNNSDGVVMMVCHSSVSCVS